MGVANGPLSASLVSRIDARVAAGIGVPWVGMAPAPAAARCHSRRTPAASITSTAALTTSGPIPSPGMRVTGIAMGGAFLNRATTGRNSLRLRRRWRNPQRAEEQEHLDSHQSGGKEMEAPELRPGGFAETAQRVDARGDPGGGKQRAEARAEDGKRAGARASKSAARERDGGEGGDAREHERHAIELGEHAPDEVGGRDPLPAAGRQRGDVPRE